MIGFTFAPHPRKNTGRENLDDIVLIPKLPKPASDGSWWVDRARDGFTSFAQALFDRRQPQSTRLTGKDVPRRRATDCKEGDADFD